MSYVAPARAPHTTGLVAYLTAETALPVGDGKAPADGGWEGQPGISPFVAYLVVHSIPGGAIDGTLGEPHLDLDGIWQVNAHGGDRLSCEIAQDLARAQLLTSPPPAITVAGRTIKWVTCDVPAGTARQDPDQPAIWSSFERYRFATAPYTA